MAKIKLHLDADTSSKALWKALLDLGHDVTRTPTDWIRRDASDEGQLLDATAQDRCIFTFNIRDFLKMSRRCDRHGGVILDAQSSWRLNKLIVAHDHMLIETNVEEWVGPVRWLNDWSSNR